MVYLKKIVDYASCPIKEDGEEWEESRRPY